MIKSFDFFLPFEFRRKHLFNIKFKGAQCLNPFLNLSREVFSNLSPKNVLDHHSANVMVIYCVPIHYLNDFQKLKLMPGVFRFLGRPPYYHSFIPLDGTFENYCAKFKSRGYKLKRKERRLAKNCTSKMVIKAYSNSKNVDEFLTCARHISRKTYQHKLLRVGFNLSEFFADYVRFLAGHGFLKSFILFDGSCPVAYLFGSLIDGHYTAHKTGYDPIYAKLSPGNVLWFKAIEDLFRDEKATFFDLSEGESRFKNYFGSESIECTNVYYLRKTTFNFILTLTYIIYTKLGELIRSFICTHDFFNQRIKSFFKTY